MPRPSARNVNQLTPTFQFGDYAGFLKKYRYGDFGTAIKTPTTASNTMRMGGDALGINLTQETKANENTIAAPATQSAASVPTPAIQETAPSASATVTTPKPAQTSITTPAPAFTTSSSAAMPATAEDDFSKKLAELSAKLEQLNAKVTIPK